MAASVRPVSEGSGAAPAAPAAAGGSPAAPAAPAVPPLKAAVAAARELVERQRAAGADVADELEVPAESATPSGEAEGETEEERAARESAAAAGEGGEPAAGEEGGETPDDELTVVLDGAHEGEELPITASDKETADRLRQLKRAAMRGDQARAIREEAQKDREAAEEINYTIELDPAGVVAERITNPADQVHLAQYLLTRPGVLQHLENWLNDMLADPETQIPLQAVQVDAMRIKRRDAVQGQVQHKRLINQNARAIIQAAERSIDSLVPADWPDEAKAQMYNDVIADVSAENRRAVLAAEQQGLSHDGRYDPRKVAGLVQRRLKLLGVAPRAAAPVGGKKPTTGTPPAGRQAPTPETLKQQRRNRFVAASAPVGAGSPAPVIQRAPAYDPKLPGTPIQQAAAWVRRTVSGLRKPQ